MENWGWYGYCQWGAVLKKAMKLKTPRNLELLTKSVGLEDPNAEGIIQKYAPRITKPDRCGMESNLLAKI